MPAPNFKANGVYNASLTAPAIAFPTGYAVNDLMILVVTGSSGSIPAVNQTNLTNNGWARVANTNTRIVGATTANVFMDIWYNRVTSTSQTTVSLGDTGDHTLALCASFANVITTGDPWGSPQVNVSDTTATAQVTSRNVTTSSANTLVLTIIAGPRDSGAAQINANPVLVGGTGDDTELAIKADWGTATGDGSTIAILTHRKPTAGATANVRANTVTAQTAITWSGALIGVADPSARPWVQAIWI